MWLPGTVPHRASGSSRQRRLVVGEIDLLNLRRKSTVLTGCAAIFPKHFDQDAEITATSAQRTGAAVFGIVKLYGITSVLYGNRKFGT